MKREPIEGECCVGITNESGRQPSGFAKVSAMILQSPDLGMDGPAPSQTVKICTNNRGGMMNRLVFTFALAVAFVVGSGYRVAEAAEGAASHYLPGANGDIFLAAPPKPGFQVANTFWYQSGDAGLAVLEGRIETDLDVSTFLNLSALTYTFEQSVLGGTYTIGAVIPFGYADLDATITGPLGRQIRTSENDFNVSDIVLIPFQMNWASGPWSFKVAELIIAPTGVYDPEEVVNLGRNYWSFDTVGAITWFSQKTGTEVSVAPGIMVNTENSKTNYRTGTEFHLDFTVNQFLMPSFALGVRGYYYQQITGDSGAGTLLGNFKSDSFGFGPGFAWIPEFGGGQLTVLGKWLHDFAAEKRFDSDYFTLTAAWKF